MNSETSKYYFTVDVEDWFQTEAAQKTYPPFTWYKQSSRIEHNIGKILELLAKQNVKGTFFTLGCVAEKHPSIVRKIVDQGHEIASHGYSHKLIYKQSQKEFKQETVKSKAILEDIAQTEVRGYRAATYSITRKSLWALDILVDAGFIYDSSIFPIRHDRYGIPDINPFPHEIKTPGGQSIVEFPISILKTRLANVPVGGGGYFRLFPYVFTRWALNRVNNRSNEFVFYIHPWEIDESQPVINKAGFVTKFRHYNNIKNCKQKLDKLLTDFKFDTLGGVLESKQLIQAR